MSAERLAYNPLATGSASRRKCLLFAVPVLAADLELLEQIVRLPTPSYVPDLPARLAAFRAAIGAVERSADGEATPDEEAHAREAILSCKEAAVIDQDFETAVYFRDIQDILSRHPDWPSRPPFYVQAARVLSRGGLAGHGALHAPNRIHEAQRAVNVRKDLSARYLADVFGPAPPVAFSPGWRTDTAVALARQMYDAREFSAMPILADALQDAGCEEGVVLSHCRDAAASHVRGCWAVDLVLGKG